MPLKFRTVMLTGGCGTQSWARRAGVLLGSLLLALSCLLPTANAEDLVGAQASTPSGTPRARSMLPASDPLNGGSLVVNMHGMLFHPAASDIDEDVAYARWLGSGVIRVFATDNNGLLAWDGEQVGNRIADIAPSLRAAQVRLIVAIVNNHRQVPEELASNSGWLDNYWQLLLPFYTSSWRGAYLTFARELIKTVQARGAQDVIFAWELGNELHTPAEPRVLMTFITEATAEVRALDPSTPILPGTMGANHVEPGNRQSPIARWLYCEAPVDAYTLHAYDFIGRDRPGDMPIDWDLDNIVDQPCPDGRTLPVVVEELGTSRALPGVYTSEDEQARLRQELRQIEFVRQFRQVVGFGVWNGESPRLQDLTFVDTRRGLTSYGSRARGGGSCYDPLPDTAPGVRCLLEQALRGVRFVRVDTADQWSPSTDADPLNPLRGSVDPVARDSASDAIALTGWVIDPSDPSAQAIDRLDVFLGDVPSADNLLTTGQLGLPRAMPIAADGALDSTSGGFLVNLPLGRLPVGADVVTLAAHSAQRGTWQTSLRVVVPRFGSIPPVAARPVAPPPVRVQPILPRPRMEIQAPAPDADVPRHFTIQVLAPGADRVDVFLDPGRDRGGRLAGSAFAGQVSSGTFQVPVTASSGPQSVYVHAHYASGPEDMQTLPLSVD